MPDSLCPALQGDARVPVCVGKFCGCEGQDPTKCERQHPQAGGMLTSQAGPQTPKCPRSLEASALHALDGYAHPSSLGALKSRLRAVESRKCHSPDSVRHALGDEVLPVALAPPSARTTFPPPLLSVVRPRNLQRPRPQEPWLPRELWALRLKPGDQAWAPWG